MEEINQEIKNIETQLAELKQKQAEQKKVEKTTKDIKPLHNLLSRRISAIVEMTIDDYFGLKKSTPESCCSTPCPSTIPPAPPAPVKPQRVRLTKEQVNGQKEKIIDCFYHPNQFRTTPEIDKLVNDDPELNPMVNSNRVRELVIDGRLEKHKITPDNPLYQKLSAEFSSRQQAMMKGRGYFCAFKLNEQ